MTLVKIKQADFIGTTFCNLRCAHCFESGKQERSREELSLHETAQVLKVLHEKGVAQLNVWGGEVMLRTDIYDVLNMAKTLFNVSVQTNATVESDLHLDKFKDIGIHISLEGGPEDTDRIRGQGVYKRALKNLYHLAKINQNRHEKDRQKITIRSTIFKNNSMEEAIRLAVGLGVNWVGVRFKPLGRGENLKAIEPTEQTLANAYKLVSYYRQKGASKIMLDEPQFYLYDDYFSTKYGTYFMQRGFVCPLGTRMLVDQRANAYPCPYLQTPHFLLGNVLSTSWSDIVENYENMLKARKNTEYTPKCQTCPWRDACGGGCTFYATVNDKNRIGDELCPIPDMLKKVQDKQ